MVLNIIVMGGFDGGLVAMVCCHCASICYMIKREKSSKVSYMVGERVTKNDKGLINQS